MSSKTLIALLALLPLAANAVSIPSNLSRSSASLNPSCAPDGNFDLSPWELQLPTGSSGHPDTETSSQLKGCSGYQDEKRLYFFTESGDGAFVMKVPGSLSSSGCVTTPNSKHCRTELREINPTSWSPNAGTNRLSATLKVTQPDNSQFGTVFGQVHIDDDISSKPDCELFYNTNGDLSMGVEQTWKGGNEKVTTVGNVPVGTQFSYQIAYENNVLSVSVNGGAVQQLRTYSLDAPASYFKVGNYNQGSDPSDVHFFAISVEY